MYKLLLLLLLPGAGELFAQKNKKHFFNEHGEQISSRQYWKHQEDGVPGYLYLTFESDTGRVHVQVKRAFDGTLPLDSLRLIRQEAGNRSAVSGSGQMDSRYSPTGKKQFFSDRRILRKCCYHSSRRRISGCFWRVFGRSDLQVCQGNEEKLGRRPEK